ncbi:MAG TPA: hypothetical protein VIV11_35905 [Kofleriaceae bacterium]
MKKTKRKAQQTTKTRNGAGGDSPEGVLIAVDKFVATRKANVERLTTRVIKKKKPKPEQIKELHLARVELAEALRLRVRVAKVVMDVEQRLRMIENSARFAIATAFADYHQRLPRS